MSIRVAIHHATRYEYDRPVTMSAQQVRLRPAPHCRSPIQAYSLQIQPKDHFINWQQDPFGNYIARLVFPEKTTHFSVEVDLVAELPRINPFDFFVDDSAETYPFNYQCQTKADLRPFLEIKEQGPKLQEYVAGIDRSEKRIVDFLVGLNQQLSQDIKYLIRQEPGVQTCEQTLSLASGSCRDTGWLLVQILRHLGLAARFVSGYLVQLTADVKALDGPSGVVQDVLDLHAWAEVYVPGAGWIGLDPTSGLFAGEGHIPLAGTPEPSTAAPISGAHDECESKFHFEMELTRLHEDPRVTKPYSEEQWQAINRVAHQVDQDLETHDVRLTMGGEPTFVSIDDMDSPQWTIAALGAEKRKLAIELLGRLHKKFAPGGLLHFGQGKWYPGEELPRWAFGCFWRADGLPVWKDQQWTADERERTSYNADDAKTFLDTLARRLGVKPTHAVPGYEDAFYYLWKERNLPANVDPLKADVKDSMERKRLARLLSEGLDKITGYALPLRWQDVPAPGGWVSSEWKFRAERMYLIPGDSPMGYRLPLDSLLYDPDAEKRLHPERCSFEQRPSLGDYHGEVARRYSDFQPSRSEAHGLQEQHVDPLVLTKADGSAEYLVRTSLCVEPRGGHLYIFLPPVSHLEHFLDLVASIEATAAELKMPVLMEGYPPPDDHRMRSFKITPDPGVIEVNLPPARDWDELSDLTETLYEEARLSRLGTEKFMLDGRHTGTGGGNHVTIGGPTPGDSPLLRRPDVLRSLLIYWQHHPALSYLFSGLFIGPTSQAPRVDEARLESLYELEIAFQQMDAQHTCFPWMVDRLLRHLLIDITGNTHRAEFCIDKLYSPDNYSGRQGLLELRCLEMPPHSRMSLAQMLLMRALVARFWREPYEQHLARHGTGLHDKYLLPHYLWQDLGDIICDLQRMGYGFEKEWFLPSLEFRFPIYGQMQADGVHLELRMAAEPWYTLGEETSAGGTSRYVDSSVERLQVKVTNMTDSRHRITCNGRPLPLQSTGTPGEYVAGVRYRAWQPPSALHPTIGVHTPLVFDVLDIWNQRSVGGCTYHVQHPGGRNSADFPVNAYEAEARRMARFWPHGHTGGFMEPPAEDRNPAYPCTLDLRYSSNCKKTVQV